MPWEACDGCCVHCYIKLYYLVVVDHMYRDTCNYFTVYRLGFRGVGGLRFLGLIGVYGV